MNKEITNIKKNSNFYSNRVRRGGYWINNSVFLRLAMRGDYPPMLGNTYVGFRFVLQTKERK